MKIWAPKSIYFKVVFSPTSVHLEYLQIWNFCMPTSYHCLSLGENIFVPLTGKLQEKLVVSTKFWLNSIIFFVSFQLSLSSLRHLSLQALLCFSCIIDNFFCLALVYWSMWLNSQNLWCDCISSGHGEQREIAYAVTCRQLQHLTGALWSSLI